MAACTKSAAASPAIIMARESPAAGCNCQGD